jgi:hypothetical protein
MSDFLMVSHNPDGTLKGGGASSGLLAAQPAASSMSGGFYYATDQDVLYLSTGAAWLRLGLPAGATTQVYSNTVPTGWVAYDGTNLPAATGIYAALYAHLGNVLAKPDTRGRELIAKGTHADVSALGNSDGVALANRTPKHNSTPALTFAGSATATDTESADHSHYTSGQTGGQSADHSHGLNLGTVGVQQEAYPGVSSYQFNFGQSLGASNDHSHAFGAQSGGRSAAHTHNHTPVGTVGGAIGPGGTRPVDSEAYIVFSVVLAKL